jgi:hypothetical protein
MGLFPLSGFCYFEMKGAEMFFLLDLGFFTVLLLFLLIRGLLRYNQRADLRYLRLLFHYPDEAAKPCWRRDRKIVCENRRATQRRLAELNGDYATTAGYFLCGKDARQPWSAPSSPLP